MASDSQQATQDWVDVVHGLRYKDYQLVAPTASTSTDCHFDEAKMGVLAEVETVKQFAAEMERKGLLKWWRKAMGFQADD